MSSGSEASVEPTIPKIDTTIMHTENKPTIYIKHYFDILYLESIGLDTHETFLSCCIRGYFNEPQTIHLELIRIF